MRATGRVPEARFELARGCPRRILSPLRLPFRHSGAPERYTASAARPPAAALRFAALTPERSARPPTPERSPPLARTLGDDGDPLDVLVLMTIPVFTGCLVDTRPIGLFHLVDRGVADEKVLAVPLGDPYSAGLSDLTDVPGHYLKEIEHFLQVYKDLEGTRTETRWFGGPRRRGQR